MERHATEMVNNNGTVRANDIIVAPDPKLRRVAQRVKEPSVNEQELMGRMRVLLDATSSLGLAATQVGVDSRIVVVNVKEDDSTYEDGDATTLKHGSFEMMNPVVISRHGVARWIEGCLSVPGYSDVVERDLVIEVAYLDRYGNAGQIKASGLLSACIQHEIDHLDGKLFIDRLSRLRRDMVLSKLKKFRRRGTMVVKQTQGVTL